MEQITANISGKPRKEMLQGREHIVVPMSLLVNGVLSGSQGNLYYPVEEISKDPSLWNGMPILKDHPYEGQRAITGRSAEVLNNQGIGVVLNARYNTKSEKLKAEGWFDVENTRRVDPAILNSLLQGKPIELSTGLYTDNHPAAKDAVYNGQPYSKIARNYRPDHVAILSDKVGACSIKAGCGVLVNESSNEGKPMALTVKKRTAVINQLITNCACGNGKPEFSEEDREVLNMLSDDGLEAMVTRQEELVANEGTTPVAVKKKKAPPAMGQEETTDDAQADNKNAQGVVVPPTKNQETPVVEKMLTENEWMEKAPPGIRAAVQNSMRIETREKQLIVNRLTGHIKDEAKKTAMVTKLMAKGLDELADWESTMPAPTANEGQQQAAYTPSYFTQAPAVPVNNEKSKARENDFAEPLVMNWDEIASPHIRKGVQK